MVRHEHILFQSDDGVTTVTLNRPEKRNALSPALIEELMQAAHSTQGGVVQFEGQGVAIIQEDNHRLNSLCDPSLTNSIVYLILPRACSPS